MSNLIIERLVQGLLTLVGIVNLLPLLGVLGAAQLRQLYGVEVADNGLALLMRHRAVLLALIGAGLLWAAARADMRLPFILAAVVSKAAFLALWRQHAPATAEIARVAWIDVGALAVLAVVVALMMLARPA
jgi:hypothetical protein